MDTKTIHIRGIPEDLHAWLMELSGESGLSMTRTVEAILTQAREQGWRVRVTTEGKQR